MNRYSGWKTAWKTIGMLFGALLAVAAAVAAVDVPDDWAQFEQAWPALLVPVGLAAWRGLENWRKNSGVRGQPRFRWPWSAAGVLVCAGLLGAGCATNRAHFSERQHIDPVSGDLLSDTEFTQVGAVTWGSTQESATGDMAYTATPEGAWDLRVGNQATAQQAGDPSEAVTAILTAAIQQALAPYVQGQAAANLVEANKPNLMETILQMQREQQQVLGQLLPLLNAWMSSPTPPPQQGGR